MQSVCEDVAKMHKDRELGMQWNVKKHKGNMKKHKGSLVYSLI